MCGWVCINICLYMCMHVCVSFMCVLCVYLCLFRMPYALFWPPAAATQKSMLHFLLQRAAWLPLAVCVCVRVFSVCMCVRCNNKINRKSCIRHISLSSFKHTVAKSTIEFTHTIANDINLIGFSSEFFRRVFTNEHKKQRNNSMYAQVFPTWEAIFSGTQ